MHAMHEQKKVFGYEKAIDPSFFTKFFYSLFIGVCGFFIEFGFANGCPVNSNIL